MEAKQVVTIYLDPMTRDEPKGEAILLKKIEGDYGTHDGHPVERWQVRFTDGDGRRYYRTVLDTSVTVEDEPEPAEDICPECGQPLDYILGTGAVPHSHEAA